MGPISLDLAKCLFSVCGMDAAGRLLRRRDFSATRSVRTLPSCHPAPQCGGVDIRRRCCTIPIVIANTAASSSNVAGRTRATCGMSRAGNVRDNSVMESFFSTLKTARTARKTYRARNEAKADVFDYIERFYNPKRQHSTIGYISPMQFEQQQLKSK